MRSVPRVHGERLVVLSWRQRKPIVFAELHSIAAGYHLYPRSGLPGLGWGMVRISRVAAVLAALLAMTMASGVQAQRWGHGHGHSHSRVVVGVGFGFPIGWPYWHYPPYGYYPYYPRAIAPAEPPST